MKTFIALLFLGTYVYADTGYPSTVRITEIDKSPACTVGQLKVSNGTLACSGQSATITIGSGSGGGVSVYPATNTATFPYGISVSTIAMTGGLSQNSVTKTGDYVVTFGEKNVLVNAVNAASKITITLPAASSKQSVYIAKVDASSVPVMISAGTGDTIVGLSTITLCGYGAQQELLADGTNTWLPVGRLNQCPQLFGDNGDVGAAAAGAINTSYYELGYLSDPAKMYGMQVSIGTSSGNLDVGIYDIGCNRLASSGSTGSPGTGIQAINFTSPVNLQPGWYWRAVAVDNTSITMTRTASTLMIGHKSQTVYPLPTTCVPASPSARPFAVVGRFFNEAAGL